MHAQRIIQGLLARECPAIHSKRAICVAAMAQAAIQGGLSLMGMSRNLIGATAIRHRIYGVRLDIPLLCRSSQKLGVRSRNIAIHFHRPLNFPPIAKCR